MKRFRKALFRNQLVQSALGTVAAFYLWLVRVTSTWRMENASATEDAWAGGCPIIIAFWHNRLFLMPYCWKSQAAFHMLISSHADGRLIAKTVKWHDIQTVIGSSSKGGGDALRQMVKLVSGGTSVGITPDGPRGPRMRASGGAIALARLSGAAIVPAAAATSGRLVMSTWDRLIVPLPFSRGACVWGDPILVDKEASEQDLECTRRTLEDSLINVSNRADSMVGQSIIAPADEMSAGEATAKTDGNTRAPA